MTLMNILLVAPSLLPWEGGVPFSVSALSHELPRYGTVQLLCPKHRVDYAFLKNQGVKHCREYTPREAVDAAFHSRHWLRQLIEEMDVVHFNGFWRWEELLLAQICRELNVPYVLQPRGMLLVGHRKVWIKRLYNLLAGDRMVSGAAAVIALSRYELKQFQHYSIAGERLYVIPNGIPKVSAERDRHRPMGSAISPLGNQPYFLYLGRIESRKNLVFLAEVFQTYLRGGGRARLVMVGPVEHGYDRVLKRRICDLGLEQAIQFRPPAFEHDKWTYVENAMAVLYPALEEPFGRVPFEAISAGVYPIIPQQSGSSEYLSGYLPHCIYHQGDPASLLECLRAIEGKKQSGDTEDLMNAQRWVHDELSWKKIVERVFAVYQAIVVKAETPSLSAEG